MPFIYYYADKGASFKWDDILSANLIEAITTVVKYQPRTFPSFHMSPYLLNIMNVPHKYPNMGWAWHPTNPTIHIYYQVLWDHKYKIEYQNIFDHFLAPLYEFIFCTPTPYMNDKSIVVIKRIENWYLMEYGTYIRVYGAMNLPIYYRIISYVLVLDRLVIQEVAY